MADKLSKLHFIYISICNLIIFRLLAEQKKQSEDIICEIITD